jgi:hypothetical protein
MRWQLGPGKPCSPTVWVRSREKMVYGNEVLHKTLSGAIGASRLKLLGRIRRKPARLPPIWGFRPFPMILGSF